MLLDECESSSFTELEGCMLLHVEEYEHARAVAKSDSFVLLPTLFWIFMPFALMLYYRYLPQEFAEQTAISSLQCQRMFKQLPMVEAANASEDVKRYFVATGLLKDFALNRDAAGKVSHTRGPEGNEDIDSDQSLGEDDHRTTAITSASSPSPTCTSAEASLSDSETFRAMSPLTHHHHHHQRKRQGVAVQGDE